MVIGREDDDVVLSLEDEPGRPLGRRTSSLCADNGAAATAANNATSSRMFMKKPPEKNVMNLSKPSVPVNVEKCQLS